MTRKAMERSWKFISQKLWEHCIIYINKREHKSPKKTRNVWNGGRKDWKKGGRKKRRCLERDISAGGSCFLSFISLSSCLSDLQEQEWTMPRLWSLPALWRSWHVMIWTRRPKWCVSLIYACIWQIETDMGWKWRDESAHHGSGFKLKVQRNMRF